MLRVSSTEFLAGLAELEHGLVKRVLGIVLTVAAFQTALFVAVLLLG